MGGDSQGTPSPGAGGEGTPWGLALRLGSPLQQPPVLGAGMFPPYLPPWGPSSVFGLAMGCCDGSVGAQSTPRTGGAGGSKGLPTRPFDFLVFIPAGSPQTCFCRQQQAGLSFRARFPVGQALFWGVFGVGFCLCSSFPPAGPGRRAARGDGASGAASLGRARTKKQPWGGRGGTWHGKSPRVGWGAWMVLVTTGQGPWMAPCHDRAGCTDSTPGQGRVHGWHLVVTRCMSRQAGT